VQFTDASQNATGWNWDFGDGATSTEQNPAHTYFSAGNFTINLKVTNAEGTDSKNATITVSQKQELATPVANFNANPTSGTVPLTVQFTDSSQNAAGWSWNFGDGANSNEPSPSHIYSAEGTYTVFLTVNNANGSASKETTITVQSQSSSGDGSSSGGSSNGDGSNGDGSNGDGSNGDDSSSGSSHGSGSSGGGGGGGAGGSPELQSNVEAKELSQTFIASGRPAKFDFPQKATPVVYVSFDSKKTAGKTTAIVEMLKNKSTLTSDVPNGEVHKYLNIWVGNAGFGNSKNIENAIVDFKVEKSWIQDKNIDKSSITLNRYSDTKWSALPTNLSGEDDKYLYFTAETPGFSSFAITGKITANEAANAIHSETQSGPNIGSLENNASNATDVKQTPEQTQNPSTKTPDFEIASGIFCLLGVFLYMRR
jgi:PGF-pre-PGF domain-containing protein